MKKIEEANLLKHIQNILLETGQSTNFKSRITKDYENTYYFIVEFDEIESTHRLAEKIESEKIPNNTILLLRSDKQSKGVGQHTNSFTSPFGNLYATLIVNVKPDFNLTLTTLNFSLSVIDTLHHYLDEELPANKSTNQPDFKLKWINDIYHKNKKIAGVIAASSHNANIKEPNNLKLIVSAGVNLNVAPQIENFSTCSLKNFTRTDINILDFTEKFLVNFKYRLNQLTLFKENDSIINDINSYLLYKNERVDIAAINGDGILGSGLFLGVNKNGSALLELENLNEKSKETKQNQEVKEFIAGKMRKKGEGILTTIYNKCRCIVNVHDKRSRKFYYFVFFSLATLLARAFLVKRSKI